MVLIVHPIYGRNRYAIFTISTGRMISKDNMNLETLIDRNIYLKSVTMDVFCYIFLEMDTSFLKQD